MPTKPITITKYEVLIMPSQFIVTVMLSNFSYRLLSLDYEPTLFLLKQELGI